MGGGCYTGEFNYFGKFMKIKHLLLGAAVAAMAVSCEAPQTELGLPSIETSVDELVFDKDGGDLEFTLVATRDWIVDNLKADWIVVSPSSGKASAKEQTITVSVLENTKMDRSEDIVFTIGMASRSVTVKQAGPGGSADALIVYANDFDKEKAVKDANGWKTYLDSFEGWKNATGTASKTVEYAFSGMSARTSASGHSAGSYSDYEGSGMNYLWFGSGTPFFSVKNITLPNATDYLLSFGAERNLYEAEDNTFSTEEFKVWVSLDDKKWVELKYEFPGVAPNRRWDLATSKFSLPAGTTKISLAFQCSVASSVLFDDLKLVISETAGTAVDFSAAVDKDFGSGSTGGNVPESKGKKTVAEFIAAADTQNYYELTGTVSGFNPTYCSFDITDASGNIYVYSVLAASKTEWAGKISNGGTITIYGKYLYYAAKEQHEVVDAHIVNFTSGEPVVIEPKGKKTVEEFIAAADKENYYELSGTVSNFNSQYSSFDLTDATGTIYVYSVLAESKQQWAGKILNGASITLYGKYLYYEKGDKHEVVDAYIVSCEGGEQPEPGEAGEYDPQGITWTLGKNAYDNTSSGSSKQTATVNGVAVANLLKLGKGSEAGDATIHIPAGTSKVGFYAMSWKNTPAEVKITMGGNSMTINPPANPGATGNPPYTITLASDGSDYFEIAVPTSDAVDVKVETTNPSAGRVVFIGLKAIAE